MVLSLLGSLPERCVRNVGEFDVDEHARGGEAGAVQVGDGGGEVLFLGLGEEDCVIDFVVGHCCCFLWVG